jgi:glycosyltransferase involved in cell wall biosynthesis
LCPGSADANFLEAWSLNVAEALMAGMPVLGARAGGIPDAAPGLVKLVDPGDGRWRNALLDLAAGTARRSSPAIQSTWDAAFADVLSHILQARMARTA